MSTNEQILRRSQLISPWGIGSIVPMPENRSLMVAGLDMWDYQGNEEEYLVNDQRLCRHLGVQELREPPAGNIDGKSTRCSVPAVLFPLWHYCPRCGRMVQLEQGSNDQLCQGSEASPHRKTKMIPERFVAICREGHIQDFPVMEWVHRGVPADDTVEHVIWRKSKGSSTGLSAVQYRCSCGAHRSLAGSASSWALSGIDVWCSGNRPWLGRNHSEKCGKELRVAEAGGSNVWFPIVKSSILIPQMKGDPHIQRELDNLAPYLSSANSDGNADALEPAIAGVVAKKLGITAERLQQEWDIHQARSQNGAADETKSDDDYRFEEYKALVYESGDDDAAFSCKQVPIERYQADMAAYFDGISLVNKLQETRAFVGFTRVEPDAGRSTKESLLQLSVNCGTKWAPAIKVFGEGIFLRFSTERLKVWRTRPEVKERIKRMADSYRKASASWGREIGEVTPEFVLIHTFSHLLINRLSFDCGYGSSSIRERIYCRMEEPEDAGNEMYGGLLLYTASEGSEGSLGGLVRMGKPGKLEHVIWHALEDALWCPSDPVCSQSHGQGPDSCNLAACHNCALLPETCCENGNRLLDRLLVVNVGESAAGYFEL